MQLPRKEAIELRSANPEVYDFVMKMLANTIERLWLTRILADKITHAKHGEIIMQDEHKELVGSDIERVIKFLKGE